MTNDLTVVSERAAFVGPCRDMDAVVFVHGLGGDFTKTWKRFPGLVATDEDLPEIDVLLWGYPTSIVRKTGLSDIETLGGHLVSALQAHVPNASRLHLVGHSMGGLVSLQGVVSELKGDRANSHPCCAVAWITLYASPVSGSTASAVVKHYLVARHGLNTQTRALARGEGIDDMLTEVYNRIYPTDASGDSKKHIPIRMIMATRDKAVSSTDRKRAKARFRQLPPLEYDFGHSSIKEPNNHDDPRYRALVNDVQTGLVSTRFRELARAFFEGPESDRQSAAIEIQARYLPIFVRVFEAHGGRPGSDDRFLKFVHAIMHDCLRSSRTPAVSARWIARAMHNRGALPQ